MQKVLYSVLLILFIISCKSKESDQTSDVVEASNDDVAASPNTLTAEEVSEGWELLFDGESFNNWKQYGSDEPATNWKISDGALFYDKSLKKGEDQNLATIEEYENFHFVYEWKIQDCGNSGVMYNVVDDGTHKHPWETGPEMQVLDNTCHPDAKFPKHRTGDLYDMIESEAEMAKPAGEWNKAEIISNEGKVQFFLNGMQIVTFTMHDESWTQMIANSKFKDMKDFGKAKKGHIVLQDHGDSVWYRNLKIRKL